MSSFKLTLSLFVILALASPALVQARYQRRPPRGGVYIPAPTVRSKNEDALKKSLAKLNQLKVDISAINKGTEPEAEHTDKLKKSLADVVAVSTKPDPEALGQLAADLNAALTQRKNTSYNSPLELATNIRTVLNRDPAQPDKTDRALTRTKAILGVAGAPTDAVKAVEQDLKDLGHRAARPATKK